MRHLVGMRIFAVVVILILICLAIIISASAVDFTPQGDIDMRNVYNVTNIPSIIMGYDRYANISLEDAGSFFKTDEVEYALNALAIVSGGVIMGNTSWRLPILDKDLTSPPAGPSEGDRYMVSGAVNWYNAQWKYRKKIEIDSTYVYDDETDYAVRVNFSGSDIIFEHALVNGSDIVFTSSDAQTKIDADKEYHDGCNTACGSNTSVFWVEVPTLSSSSNTTIYVYYGNPGASEQYPDSSDAWNADYGLVYHMNINCCI